MKNNILFAVLALSVLFIACGESKQKKLSGMISEKKAEIPAPENPEYKKLEKVLSGMSARFSAAVSITDKDAFLSDLHKVLDAEKLYRQDDLPLYYLIDKKHYVSSDYVPKDLVSLEKNSLYNINRKDLSLRPDAEASLRLMAAAAKEDGITLLVSSTYRSYDYQKRLFQHWVDVDGLEEAERESARPGTSQHQLGTAIDFGSITDDFADTAMGKWVYAHGPEFGWSLSFPKDYEDVTGYRWESWHFRFIGEPACRFQKKYFANVQQFMLEFIDAWKQSE